MKQRHKRSRANGMVQAAEVNNEAYRELFRSHPEPMWVYDRSTFRFLAVNDAAVASYGYTEEEFLGMTIKDIRPAEDLTRLLDNLATRDAEYSTSGMWRHLKKDGSLIAVDITSHAVTFEGLPARLVRAHEITAQLQAEETRVRLQHALNATRDVVIMTDPDGTIRFVNDAFTRLYGFPAEEALGQTPRILKSGKHEPEVYKELWQLIRAGKTIHAQMINKTKAGRLVTIEASIDPILDDHGRPGGFIAIQRDISTRKQTEERLEESELRFRQLTENIQHVFWMTDPKKSEMLYVSPAYEKIWGHSVKALYRLPQLWMEAIHPDDRERVQRAAHTKQVNGSYNEVYRIICPDGTIKWIRDRAFPVKNDIGETYRLTGIAADITEYVTAENALHESESRFRALAHASPASIFTYTDTFLYVNPATEELTGYSRDELLKMRFWDVVHPDHREMVRGYGLARLRGEPCPGRYEFKILRKNGEERWVDFSAGMFKPNGKSYAVGTAFDVTERKRTDEALRESEDRFRRLAENAEDIIYRYEFLPKRCFTYVSPAATRITGFTPEEHYADPDLGLKLVYPDDLPLLRTLETGPASNGSLALRWIRKDGSIIWTEQRNVRIFDASGRLVAIEGIARDITERKKSEEALRRSEERYRQFFEEDLTGDFISTADGTLLDCNPAFVKIFGFKDREQALQTPVTSLYPESEIRTNFLKRLGREKSLAYVEETMHKVDGTPIHVVENVVGVFDAAGALTQIRGYLFDDTKRKQIEQQLYQSQKLESIGTLASGIAHDFNNILGIILGHAGILAQEGVDRHKQRQSIEAISTATQRGASLVRQILTFARKTESHVESVSLNSVVEEIAALLRQTFPKNILIELDLHPAGPAIMGDHTQIHQTLLNLALNARDAMPSGGVVRISTEFVLAADKDMPETTRGTDGVRSYVCVSVEDTGTGIDDKTRERIFEPFFTTKEKGKGTGLGLAVVYGVVNEHNGHITMDSEIGRGTAFQLYFPAATPEIPRAENAEPEGLFQQNASGTILLIEDEEMLVELLSGFLTAKGYTVLTAPDGEEGVALFARHRAEIAMVITDLGLPKLEGEEVVKRIKAIDPTIPVAIASGFVEPGTKLALRSSGVAVIMQKPYLLPEVLRSIQNVITKEPRPDGRHAR